MKLHELPSPVKGKVSKRVGRGFGSGKGGHTSGRGTKGQRARTGTAIPLWFEGGQLPLNKKLPYLRGKLRFSSLHSKVVLVTLTALQKLGAAEITLEKLIQAKVVKKKSWTAKIVGTGELSMAVKVSGIPTTKAAKEAIEKAGGSVA